MFDVHDDFRVTFESDAAVEAFEFVAKLYEYMPPGAVGYTFLDVVDAMVTERAGIVFYWGRVFGRAAEGEHGSVSRLEAYQHAAHHGRASGTTGTTSRAFSFPPGTMRTSMR